MKYLLTSFLLLYVNIFYGQFAVIADKDSSTNVRDAAARSGNISDKLYNGHLVYIMENKGNWMNIEYSKKKKDLSGFIYKDNCREVSGFQEIPVKKSNANSVTLAKDSIEISISLTPFVKKAHKYKYYLDAATQIELIDNEHFWGTDGSLPKTQYGSVSIRIGQSFIQLPPAALKNLYEPNLSTTIAHFDKDKNILYIEAMNSDGGGGYEVIWKIEKAVYKDRLVAYGF